MSGLEVKVSRQAGIVVAAVRGEVDLEVRDLFERGVGPIRDGQGPAVLDLSRVPFMDSTGLHVIVQLWQALRREGRQLALACGRDGVRKLFELTALDRDIRIYETAAHAVDALRRGEPRLSAVL